MSRSRCWRPDSRSLQILTCPPYSKNETLDDTDGRIADSLTSLDLEVREGYFQMWGIEQCLPTYELMGTCFFNNPAAPYILPGSAVLG